DEPTAVLTVQETAKLFDVLRRMKAEGHAIIIITHKLNEVLEISDRVSILRKGEYITTVDTAQTDEQQLTEFMVGHKVDLNIERPVVEKTRPLLEIRDLPDVTRDGTRVELYANIGGPEDVEAVLGSRGAGVGLFRSEFLYLEKETYPTEDELFSAYRQTAERMGGREVVIRTLDIGADKTADYFGIEKEANPAMGFRALRICLKRPEIFHTQLRAIYRASAYGKVSVMFPMVASLWEVEEAKAMALQVREELEREGIPMGHVDLGIMIETPAAAILSGELAEKVDFFSIGTNDLTQYILAADRGNQKLTKLYSPFHPAVLRAVAKVIAAGHKEGKEVGMCGEFAADARAVPLLLGMGLDEFSMVSNEIAAVRYQVRGLAAKQTAELARRALAAGTEKEVRGLLER
ncbi:MAG: phosphoenolpyruvate--protein phosphotransferase, partial [Firmicutes bacterium]|nr:phosphoenolpyruvate--protein phosphotransferase [Bacillota bacterium]